MGNLVLTDEGLAGTGLGGHENILVSGDGGDCVLLERVERVCVVNRECLREGLAGTRGVDDVEKGHFVGWGRVVPGSNLRVCISDWAELKL